MQPLPTQNARRLLPRNQTHSALNKKCSPKFVMIKIPWALGIFEILELLERDMIPAWDGVLAATHTVVTRPIP